MYKRILVPLDGSAPAEAVVNPAREHSCSEPSLVSSLVDGLEAEAQTDPNTIPASRQWDATQTFSLRNEKFKAEAILAVADAM
jgi:nucleotide-binding universal stress UspA family protein